MNTRFAALVLSLTLTSIAGAATSSHVVSTANPLGGVQPTDVVTRIVVDVPEMVDRTAPFQGTVSAWDASSQVVPGYRGTVHFRGTDSIVFPPDYTFTAADNGTHTFTFTANRGGNHVITAEDVSDPTTGSSDSFYVNCPELTAAASNGGPVCPNGVARTPLMGSSNQAGVSYYWSGPHTWFSFEQNPSAPGPGTYFLDVTNAEGCVAHAQTTVEAQVMHHPNFNVHSTYACGGDTVNVSVFDAADFSNYEWALEGPGTIVSGQGTSSIEIVIGEPGGWSNVTIHLAATYNPTGCQTSSLTYVNIDHRRVADISTASSACPNATLTASVPAQPSTTYEWSITNGTITKLMGPTIEYVVDGTGDVVLNARLVANACESTGTAVVALEDAPDILEEPRNVTISSGSTATLSVTATGSNLMYFWYRGSAGDRSHPVASGLSRTYTTPALTEMTKYWVEVEGGCGTTQSRTVVVDVSNKRRAARH